MTIAEKLVTIAENEPKVFEAGKKAEWGEFWDNFQDYGNGTVNYQHAFSRGRFTDKNYKPKYKINGYDIYSMFQNAPITDTLVDIISTYSSDTHGYSFSTPYMVTIRYFEVLKTQSFVNTFSNATKLQNIKMGGEVGKNINFQYSPLTKESIKSVVAVLSDDVTGRTLTLKETAVNNAFETSEGAADGATSAEWLSQISTKPNWTISLV